MASFGDVPKLSKMRGLSQKVPSFHPVEKQLSRICSICGVPPKVQQSSHKWSSEQDLAQVPKSRQAYSSLYFYDVAELEGKLFMYKSMTYILTPTSLEYIVLHFFPVPFFGIHLNCMYGLLLSSHSQGPPNRCCRC